MNHRKSSRNKRKKSTEDDNNYKVMRVRRVQQTNIAQDAHGTSIYEIDIKSSIEFSPDPVAEDVHVKLCVANVAPVSLKKKKNNGVDVDFNVVGNPFIESHYPRFLETETESEGPPAEESDHTAQPIIHHVSDLESSIKPNSTHIEKENSLPDPSDSSKTKTRSRKPTVKGYLCKTDNAWPLFGSSSIGTPEDSPLHLHHHEHHHHYHCSPATDGEDATHLHRTCESPESITGGRKRHSRRRMTIEDDGSRHCYHTCTNTANPSPTVTRVVINTQASVPDSKHTLSDSFKTTRSRASSSAESMRVKKSNLIKTHNYSDTELVRCESDGNSGNVQDTFRVDLLRKKDSKTNAPLVSAPKNFQTLKETSREAVDQKPIVKSVYIRCKYPVQGMSESTVAFTEAEMSSMAKKEAEEIVKSDSDSPPFVIKKGEDGTLDIGPIEIWAEKIKCELKEIKKTLRIIEKECLGRKHRACTDNKDTISKSDDGSAREISVFSSRTFILRAENFYIIDDSDSGALSEDLDNFITRNEEVCYAETERGHFFLSPNGSWLHIKNEDRAKKYAWNRSVRI